MKIIYSPFYSGGYYIDLQKRKDSLLGLKVCGSLELLSELELRAGIVSQELSEPERLVDFHKALSEHIAHTIFEQSFKNDEIGVSRQLMSWSDNLLMEGWTPESDIDSPKLKDLAKIVKGVNNKHISARWKDLATYVSSHPVLHTDDSIEVHDKDQIPAVIKMALEELAKQTTVSYVANEGDIPSDFKVYHFKTHSDANQWYLSQPEVLEGTDVTISTDNCMLNDMAIAMGQPVVNSISTNSNPQLLQLFKLGMSLFTRPLNVYNLLSYLQIPGNPLGGVSYKLARVLANEGGINEKWDEVIRDYDFTDEKGKDKRSDKLAFIEMLNKEYDADRILVDDVKNYAGKLAHWCDLSLRSDHVDDERKEQLVVLASFCRSLHQILPADGYITSETLKAHIDGIYRPQSFTHMKAQKNAPDTIVSVNQLADDSYKVCWLGCVGASLPSYPFDFLNTTELDMLHAKGIMIPARSAFYTQHHQQEMDALKRIRQLILVTWDFDNNERQEEHPLITELKHTYQDEWENRMIRDAVPNLKEDSGDIHVLEPQTYYDLSSDLANLKRDTESYSSIDSLIQHPFDYTMTHLLKLNEPQVGKLPDLDTTEGLVAHLFVQKLFNLYGEQMADEYQQMNDTAKSDLLYEAIQQKGAVLLLPEYKLECQQFESILKESITVLTNIMQHLHLKPIGSEVEFNVSLDTIGAFGGSIDMVLKNDNDDLVIFDFKWSEAKHFKTDLEERKAMQLELYAEAAQKHYGKPIVGVAYYLFPLKTMFTTYFPDSDHIRHIKVKTEVENRNILKEVQNAYQYRHNELNRGHIEDGEMTEIDDLEYTKASTAEKPLYPIDVDYNNKDKKGCPYVKVDKPPFAKKKAKHEKPKSDPKEIKTTHPILKGRLV